MARPKRSTWTNKVRRTYAIMTRHGEAERSYLMGEVYTPDGIVVVYTQDGHSNYRLMHLGRVWSMSEDRRRTTRGLAIIAARWAFNVVNGRIIR